MSDERYPEEQLGLDDDDGTMPNSRDQLAEAVVGHRIVSAEVRDDVDSWHMLGGLVLTLDNGTTVTLENTSDCCASTEVTSFLLNPDMVDHIITGVGTTDGFSTWHIYADAGDVMSLGVGWSCGNPFYYGYGFSIQVKAVPDGQ